MDLRDEKFRVATQFSVEQLSQPIGMKIVSSVLFAYAKVLAQFCPHVGVTSGHPISNYFSENFVPWYTENFPLLSSDPSVTSLLRNKTQGWFRTNLKRLYNKTKSL